jgi:hypothetical protein
MSWFRRRPPSALERLRNVGWVCACCKAEHLGIFDLGAPAPDQWGQVEAVEPNHALRLDGNFLSDDFCVIEGEHFFVRGRLEIPVLGAGGSFGYGCWSTLARTNFEIYVDTFDGGDQGGEGPWFGWFSNRLLGFEDTLNRPCEVAPQSGRVRPILTLEDPGHELSRAQEEGITPERLLEIYAAYGHAPAE